jgi:hypothetical protein
MELVLMIASAAAGFFQVDWWFAVLVGFLLTLLGASRNVAVARQNADVGAGRVLALSFGASTLNNVVFAVLTFAAGRVFAWLIAG